jgi:hypothetical protein
MKLSRKAKKRLIILGVILSPFVIIAAVYLSYLKEPSTYTQQKRIIAEHRSQINSPLQDKVTLEENDDPTTASITSTLKNELYEVYRALQNSLNDIGPLQGGGYVADLYFPLNNEEQISQWWIDLHPKAVSHWGLYTENYSVEKELPLHLLDQFSEWESSYEEFEPIRSSDFDLLKYSSWCDLMILAAYRAHLAGDQELCHRLYTRYTQILLDHSAELSYYWMVKFPGFVWACYDLGLLSDEDLLSLKNQLIEKHQEISINRQSDRRLVHRNKLLIEATEQFCQQLQTEELGKDTETLNVMLKESLGGLPKKAWDGLVSPIYCYRIRDYAAVLCTNDLDKIRQKRKAEEFFLGSKDFYHRVRSLEEIAFNNETGVCPDQIYKDFSSLRETDWFQNKLLALIALMEILEHHAQYGSYPMGEYTEKLPADYTPEYHRFYIVKTDELSIPVIHWEDETTTKTINKDIPERYHLRLPLITSQSEFFS